MMPTVVLALRTSLDVAAARALADYGRLNDAGVARALEQVHIQRWGRADVPGHLARIGAMTAIVAAGERLHRVVMAPGDDEADSLAVLFAAWPGGDGVRIVDWDGSARATLVARAIACECVAPPRLDVAVRIALGELAAPRPADHPAPADAVERECLALRAGPLASADLDSLAGRAAARYRLWLRSEYCAGRLAADARRVAEQRLRALPELV